MTSIIKKSAFYLLPLVLAFTAMVAVNEYSRLSLGEGGKSKGGITRMNTAEITPEACTWNCFRDTMYCKVHHTRKLGAFSMLIDPLYFGMITALMLFGNYGGANVLFLVVLWPLIISYLIVKPILLQARIKKLQKQQD